MEELYPLTVLQISTDIDGDPENSFDEVPPVEDEEDDKDEEEDEEEDDDDDDEEE